ncbi:ribosome-binding factor A [Clostridium carboxidivorans P7]|uniref:Ribosome-binding factor A n=1 Tax=Clostridium carboxidivorans P7 TaxID=536227 RepID=C6PQW9_9CLOT|nr:MULTISPECIES: 30S ribosome-binding factor RbfA [Clostridium]AKN29472.1 ribosome-binding factor A [Clostridium carboxidivorans P7]EET88333.1 ribosome-binding factor A [Clostridium carboxidivorans P7]EFG89606.1 ribosome-binding factor A [Clostridium carboxidivorans P7]WPC40682.1 30S ribosome-binding factor RbfA [Clostridium sp. JS66]
MAKYRSGRINEEMKREISTIIQNDIKDPRLSAMISVTKVDVTKDLRYAKVYVSIFGDEESKNSTFEALKGSAGFIRREIGHKINLRYTPEILIELDNTIEQGMHIDALLHKIKEKEHHDNE